MIAVRRGFNPHLKRCRFQQAGLVYSVRPEVSRHMEAERRSTRRFLIATPIEVKKVGGMSTNLAGATRDFSTAGAFLYLSSHIEPGSRIVVVLELGAEITLTESAHVVCEGQVLRAETSEQFGPGVAVQIDNFQFFESA